MNIIIDKEFTLDNGTRVFIWVYNDGYSFVVDGKRGSLSHEAHYSTNEYMSLEVNEYYGEGENFSEMFDSVSKEKVLEKTYKESDTHVEELERVLIDSLNLLKDDETQEAVELLQNFKDCMDERYDNWLGGL